MYMYIIICTNKRCYVMLCYVMLCIKFASNDNTTAT